MKKTVEIEMNEEIECCAVCRFFKVIQWEQKGEVQVTQCLLSGQVSEYRNKKRTNAFSRYENCLLGKK